MKPFYASAFLAVPARLTPPRLTADVYANKWSPGTVMRPTQESLLFTPGATQLPIPTVHGVARGG